MYLMPRESAKLIAKMSKNVFIEDAGVKKVAHAILATKGRALDVNNFSQHELHPSPEDPRAVDWIFVLDTLNYSFWSKADSQKWTVNGHTGYFALCAAIKRAIDEGIPITDPKYYSGITRDQAEQIFRGDNETVIPLFDERIKSLRESGEILLLKYKGTFLECVKSCAGSAEQLLKLIVKDFESFRDVAEYEEYKVSFYKRAQILVGDLWACFKGDGPGKFHDIDYITMFADYRIPQVLVSFGAIRYSNVLLNKLQCDVELKNGSADEVEIRGCSIETIERVVDEVKSMLEQQELEKTNVNAILVDHFLWDYRREHAAQLESIPFHKTRCIYY